LLLWDVLFLRFKIAVSDSLGSFLGGNLFGLGDTLGGGVSDVSGGNVVRLEEATSVSIHMQEIHG
jgi:hypothetical protein